MKTFSDNLSEIDRGVYAAVEVSKNAFIVKATDCDNTSLLTKGRVFLVMLA